MEEFITLEILARCLLAPVWLGHVLWAHAAAVLLVLDVAVLGAVGIAVVVEVGESEEDVGEAEVVVVVVVVVVDAKPLQEFMTTIAWTQKTIDTTFLSAFTYADNEILSPYFLGTVK